MAVQEPPTKQRNETISDVENRQRMWGYVLTGIIIILVLGMGFPVTYNPLWQIFYRLLWAFHLFFLFNLARFMFMLLEVAAVVLVARKFGITPVFGIPLGSGGRVLGKAQIVDRWDILISGAKGRGDGVLHRTEQLVVETEAPDVGMKTQKVSPGVLQGMLGAKRTFLVTSVTTNTRLKPYRMYINARDYGVQLQVSWYVAFQPGFLLRLINFLLCIPVLGLLVLPIKSITAKPDGLLGLDIFDEQDLRACVTNAHHCLLEAVEKLMVDLHQDPSKIDRKSRGFLGIS